MAEYIEREEMLSDFSDCNKNSTKWTVQRVSALIYRQPAADVAPVVHGRWIERQAPHAMGGVSAKCSACGKNVQYLGNPLNYCPIRGAQMDDVQQLAGELNHAAQCVAEGCVTWADIRQMLKEYGVETALE